MKLRIYVDSNTHLANPGRCAVGIVIEDNEGTTLQNTGRYIGRTTNNVGEWTAVLDGLTQAMELNQWTDVRSVEIFSDSQLVANQASGRWQVRSRLLKPLVREWRRLATSARRPLQVTWIRRGKNKAAHDAANEALYEAVREIEGLPWLRGR